MIVDDFNLGRPLWRPHEANPVAFIDTDAVLSASVTAQFLQAISGRHRQVGQPLHRVHLREFPLCDAPEIDWKPPTPRLAETIVIYVFGCRISERDDHQM